MDATTFYARVNEDGSASALGRVVARDGTGTAIAGEGKCLKQADLTSVIYSVVDTKDASVVATAILTTSAVIYDTLQKDEVWDLEVDALGYNFAHDLASTSFPNADRVYLVRYKFTTTGSTVAWGEYSMSTRKTS